MEATEIDGIRLSHMRNDEHFEFMTHFVNLVNATGVEKLKIRSIINR